MRPRRDPARVNPLCESAYPRGQFSGPGQCDKCDTSARAAASARLVVLAANPADGAARGTHDHAFGGHRPALQSLDALQERAVGDPGRGEDAVALGELGEVVLAVEVGDPPAPGAG